MAAHPDHPLRQQLEAGLEKLAVDLQTSDDLRRRGEEIKAELLGQPQIRGFAAAVWQDLKEELRAQAERPGSELRSRLASLIMQTGARLRDDPAAGRVGPARPRRRRAHDPGAGSIRSWSPW